MGELDGKVAIVTAAGRYRGIGRCAAVALARLGADVVITGTGRDPSTYPDDEKEMGWRDIEGTAEQVREAGRRCLPLVVDVTKSDQVQMMVDRTLEEFGRVDILVNNAASPRGADRVAVVDLDEEVFRWTLEVKVTGTFLCSRAVARILTSQGQGGKIVNISSVIGKTGPLNAAAYAAANSAVHGFTMSFAREMSAHNVNVNTICPGTIDTVRNDVMGREEVWREAIDRIPLRRAGTPEEIADCIAFLCTGSASYIQGQCINVNGGLVMEH